jgi:hypothetical protein
MRKANGLPTIAANVTSRDLGDEFVVLNTTTQEAHALQGQVAVVWRSVCEDTNPRLPEEQVKDAVQALLDLGLLIPPAGMSRRSMFKTGGAIAAVGIITIGLPEVAAASSNGPQSISVSSNPAQAGTVITLSGVLFGGLSSTLTATFNGSPLALTGVQHPATNSGGTIQGSPTFIVPSLPKGFYNLVVTDSAGNMATLSFHVN